MALKGKRTAWYSVVFQQLIILKVGTIQRQRNFLNEKYDR